MMNIERMDMRSGRTS